MSPRAIHRNPSRQSRKDTNPSVAHAPYNFIPLPEQVAAYSQDELPGHDRFYLNEERYTGRIDCHLTTLTPLFIRGQAPLEEFSKPKKDSKKKRTYQDDRPEFFRDPGTGLPMIPGSSLRGMLRTLVEILSNSKFGPVSERAVYYRSLADRNTSVRDLYKEHMERRRAGWIVQEQGLEEYSILPVPEIDGRTYFRVHDKAVQEAGIEFTSIYDEDAYKQRGPQIIDVYFLSGTEERVEKISAHGGHGFIPAKMICSGPMGKPMKRRSKKNHWVVPKVSRTAGVQTLPLPETVVEDYLHSLTEYQKTGDLDPERGVLRNGLPVFFITNDQDQVLVIGHTANFRIPYLRPGGQQATKLSEMVPEPLRDKRVLDYAEAIFGYVKSKEVPKGITRAYAGRVRVGNARMTWPEEQPWMDPPIIIPRILSNPKPTSYQLYLTQPTPDERPWRDQNGNEQYHRELLHYGSPAEKAEPRGHKAYWHQDRVQQAADFQADQKEVEEHPSQYTQIQPVRPGIQFQFSITFENLSKAELGALLWALRLPGDDTAERRHRLGMGKPLGLGSVKIEPTLHLDDRLGRYAQIWDEEGSWALPERIVPAGFEAEAIQAFEEDVMERSGYAGQSFRDQPRIQMLQTMLAYRGPDADLVKYMTITPNEYAGRAVLPDPLHLHGLAQPDPQATPPMPPKEQRSARSRLERQSSKPDQDRGRRADRPPQPPRQPRKDGEIPELRDKPSAEAEEIWRKLFGGKDGEE